MPKYVYVDPVVNGFTKVHFTKREHNELFPNRKIDIFSRYDYYISHQKLILHRTTSRKWTAVITIGFPLVAVGYGIFNLRELLNEYRELYNQKRLGSFLSDECWSNSDTYAAAVVQLKNSGQWS